MVKKLTIFFLSLFTFYSEELILDFSTIFEEHKIPRLVLDTTTGEIVKANIAAAKYYKYDLDELLNMNINQINIARDTEITEKISLAQSEKENYFRFQHKLGNGSIREVEVYSYPFYSNDRLYLYSLIFDVTEKINSLNKIKKNQKIILALSMLTIVLLSVILYLFYMLKEKYKDIAYRDCLTGAHNRRILDRRDFNKECCANDKKVIVMIDINDFKEINDKYGHIVGDEVLQTLACLLKGVLRKEDIIVRYGGDEFLLILNNINVERVRDIMKRIEHKLEISKKFPFVIKISYGVKGVSNNSEIMESIKTADESMYKMKKEKIK